MSAFAKQIFGTPGYSTDIHLEPEELAVFQDEVERQWLQGISSAYPAVSARFRELGMTRYHQGVAEVDHRALWPKQFRVLPADSAARIKKLGFLERLREALGPFRIAEIVVDNQNQPGTEEIYWRLVRPDAAADIGPLHADQWFHKSVGHGAGQFAPDEVTVKLWIALHTEARLNGLLVVPNTHREQVAHATVTRDGVAKPQIGRLPDHLAPVLVPAEPGTVIAFNERLIHGGAVNRGQSTRVSSEITLVLPRAVETKWM